MIAPGGLPELNEAGVLLVFDFKGEEQVDTRREVLEEGPWGSLPKEETKRDIGRLYRKGAARRTNDVCWLVRSSVSRETPMTSAFSIPFQKAKMLQKYLLLDLTIFGVVLSFVRQ